jgi:hypothetical protein
MGRKTIPSDGQGKLPYPYLKLPGYNGPIDVVVVMRVSPG